jgi:hypothetical protein
MRKCLPALAAVTLLCSSCLPVPFDLALSQGAAAAARMTLDNPSLLTASSNYGSDQNDFVFYPSVLSMGGFDYGAGLITSADSMAVQIRAVAGGSQYSGTSQGIPNPDRYAPAYVAWPVKSGQSFLLGIVFDALNPATGSGYALLQGNPVARTLNTINSSPLQVLDPVSKAVIGASVAAEPPSLIYDMLHLLSVDAAGTSFREVSWWVESAGLFTQNPFRATGAFFPLPLPSGMTFPPGTTRVMYFYDENQPGDPARLPNRSFMSWFDAASGSWRSCAWWEIPATGSGTFSSIELPIDHRIDALLTTGQLFSTEGGTGRLYDRDGNLLATFPLGNLAFIGEQYVGGVPRCYFSQCLIYDRTQHFNVYWIRTDKLATLAD